jgi:hypothetical protein
MIDALQEKEGGRPPKPQNTEQQLLKKQVAELEAQERMRSQVERIRDEIKGGETSAKKK